MEPVDPIARVLQQLIEKRSISRSSIGRRAKTAIKPLFDAGALKEERCGAGWRIHVVNSGAVEKFSRVLFPQGLESSCWKLDRAEAVAVLRNAKRGSNRSGEPVLIRGFSEAMLVSERGELDIQRMTQFFGTASFVISDELDLKYTGSRVALVENLEPFLRFEERFSEFDAAIYCAGRISVRVLCWLEHQRFDVVHFGDYDPVGLQEYLRIKERCGCRASLYIPEKLNELVKCYGKPELLKDSSAILEGLRATKDVNVCKVLQCLEDLSLGLEQEILWADLLSIS